MAQSETNRPLRYVGDGSALLDVPARDLSAQEVEACPYTADELIETGLYKDAPAEATPPAVDSTEVKQ